MPEYKLSLAAERDIVKIADYTIEKFGIQQARVYRRGLVSSFEELASDPKIGRLHVSKTKKQLLRYRYKSHMIFFKETHSGILIVRVLGSRMDFNRHL